MKLTSVQVENFKCVENSEPFTIGQVTCLVGKNEAGKSALLQALEKLNPIDEDRATFNDVMEYPRRRYSEYTERRDKEADNVLTTVWALEEVDKQELEELLGPGGMKAGEVVVTKGYDNEVYWTIPIDEGAVVQGLLESAELFNEEREALQAAKTIGDLKALLEATDNPSEHLAALGQAISTKFPGGEADQAAITLLESRLPRFLYFSEYDKLPGRVSIPDFQARIREDKPRAGEKMFIALLRLAGREPEELTEIGQFEELIAEVESVSNRLGDEIFNFWSQNRHLEVRFTLDAALKEDPPPFNTGSVFNVRIRNNRHRASVSFDERSTGFVWFFSFLVWFSQARVEYGENLIILLDEPGLGLHGKAQEDLLRYIRERLEPHFQVIYSAHSPFMVDPDNLLRARTVEDVVTEKGEILGTKVGDKVLSTDKDTIFPLQAAMGFSLTQTLFVGKHTLLVEGPGDLLYLDWFSSELRRLGRVGLDRRWVIAPAGGVDKIATFITLLAGNKLHVAVFTDIHRGTKKKVKELRESELLRAGHVFSADMLVGQDEADIEDVIGREMYLPLVDSCYKLEGKNVLGKGRPRKTTRVLEEVEDHFRTLPADAPEFDHYDPAEFLITHGHEVRDALPGLAQALDRFEELFKQLNPLLPPQ